MKPKATVMGPVICRRKLVGVLPNKKKVTATVRVGKPRRHGRDWVCPFHISHIGQERPVLAYGVDSAQALIMALVGVRATIDKSEIVWSWFPGRKGDTGFPRWIPMGFDVNFTRKLEQLVEREVARFAWAAERRNTRRQTRP